jgi:HTH domain
MPIQKNIQRIVYIDSLIKTKSTGPVKHLAKKLNLSERTTLEHLKEMKLLGCPIKYCRKRNSYYYSAVGEVVISFFDKHFNIPKDSGGGKGHCVVFFVKKPNCKNTAVSVYNLVFWFNSTNKLIPNNGTKFSYKSGQCCQTLYTAT